MPHTHSASKRLRQNERRRRRNRAAAKKIKLQRKAIEAALSSGDAAKTQAEVKTTQMVLDRAATKGYIHPNKAARLKSRLVKRLRASAAPKAEAKK